MIIEVLAFGIAKDIFGASSISFDLGENNLKVSGLRQIMENDHPKLKALSSYMIAINNNYASLDDVIHQNDEVALIPPVTGG